MGRRGRAPREGAEGAPREGAEGGRRQRRRHLQLGERREQVALQIDLLVDTHVDAAPRRRVQPQRCTAWSAAPRSRHERYRAAPPPIAHRLCPPPRILEPLSLLLLLHLHRRHCGAALAANTGGPGAAPPHLHQPVSTEAKKTHTLASGKRVHFLDHMAAVQCGRPWGEPRGMPGQRWAAAK
eukprot:scaffold8853_cov26-Phaeocystis_antarctica.AAC.1